MNEHQYAEVRISLIALMSTSVSTCVTLTKNSSLGFFTESKRYVERDFEKSAVYLHLFINR